MDLPNKFARNAIPENRYVLRAQTCDNSSSNFEFYEVTLSENKFHHGDEELNYAQLIEKFNDNKYFLYLKHLNLIFIPSIETDDALAFSVAWTRREEAGDIEYPQPYISRVIINSDEVIRSEQTGVQSNDMILESYEDYDEQYGGKMYPSAKAVKDLVGEGGEQHLYAHEIKLEYRLNNNHSYASLKFLSTEQQAYSLQSFGAELMNKGYVNIYTSLSCSGSHYDFENSTYGIIIGVCCSSDSIYFAYQEISIDSTNKLVGSAVRQSRSYYTKAIYQYMYLTDTVEQIF